MIITKNKLYKYPEINVNLEINSYSMNIIETNIINKIWVGHDGIGKCVISIKNMSDTKKKRRYNAIDPNYNIHRYVRYTYKQSR